MQCNYVCRPTGQAMWWNSENLILNILLLMKIMNLCNFMKISADIIMCSFVIFKFNMCANFNSLLYSLDRIYIICTFTSLGSLKQPNFVCSAENRQQTITNTGNELSHKENGTNKLHGIHVLDCTGHLKFQL